jgi:hypothetical protein
MLLTFATADDVYAEYVTVMIWGLIVIVLTIIALGAANKGSPSEVRTSTAIRIGIFSYLLLAIVSYQATYGSFIGADIGEHEARLYFAGSLYRSTILKREQIREVLVGFPGKGTPHSCYIKFNTISGESYRSAAKEGKVCTDYRAQIRALMKL